MSKLLTTVDEVVNAWHENHFGQDLVTGLREWAGDQARPVFFAEVGYQAREGSLWTPWWSDGSYRERDQRLGYEALYAVWTKEAEWLEGIFWWGWIVPVEPSWDDHFSPRGRAAEAVIRARLRDSPIRERVITIRVDGAEHSHPVLDGWWLSRSTSAGSQWSLSFYDGSSHTISFSLNGVSDAVSTDRLAGDG